MGVKVYLLGGDKGIDQEILGVGRYWIGWNEELYLFPTFQQNYVWTKDKTEGSPTDESITFQTKEGLSINTDVGISLSVERDILALLFQLPGDSRCQTLDLAQNVVALQRPSQGQAV